MSNSSEQHLREAEAEVIRQACIKAAKQGFMEASISGLCTEGAMEAAISSIQNLDLSRILKD